MGLEWERAGFNEGFIYRGGNAAQTKQKKTPALPIPTTAGMRFKAPTGKKLSGEGEGGGKNPTPKKPQKLRGKGATSWRCRFREDSLFFRCWRLVTKNLAESAHFLPLSPIISRKGRREVAPEGHRFNPFGFSVV